jgi:hypothetical protein
MSVALYILAGWLGFTAAYLLWHLVLFTARECRLTVARAAHD